jgi:uncharacterized protein
MEGSAPRIFLRPIGSPLTIAMAGLAIASLLQAGLDLRWIATTEARQAGVILLTVPFVLQLLGSVYSYLARDGAAGAAIGVLATTWAGLGAVHLISSPGSRSGALGLLLLGAGGVLLASALAVCVAKPLPGLVFTTAAVRFALSGVYELGGSGTWRDAAGIVSLVVLGLSGYCVLAFELEDQKRRPVLPTFRRQRGAAAMSDGVAAQLDTIAHEAGVRQTI